MINNKEWQKKASLFYGHGRVDTLFPKKASFPENGSALPDFLPPLPSENENHSTIRSPTGISPHNSFPPQNENEQKASTSCFQSSESVNVTFSPCFHRESLSPLRPVRFPSGHFCS